MSGRLPLFRDGCIILSPRQCAAFVGPVLEWLVRERVTDEELAAGARAMEILADQFRASRMAAISGSGEFAPLKRRWPHDAPMDVSDVAADLGVTPRHVRWLASKGRLAGVQVAGRWLFEPAAVGEYRAARAAS